MNALDDLFTRLARSGFRSRFRLRARERDYLRTRGLEAVLEHGRKFVDDRLAPAEPPNDGKQTPMRNHPVFVAQHATATCCRGCLAKWHGIPTGYALTFELGPDELGIVRSWKDLVAGEFYALKFLKKHTVFLAAKDPAVAYSVLPLADPFEDVIEQPLPFYCKAVLLPFKGRIVYDGLLSGYNVLIGRNMARELSDAYNEAKKRYGIVLQPQQIRGVPGSIDG
jgi:hypothetical protein